MSPVLPALSAAALSGLHDIKGIIPAPGLPPFAVSALVTLTALGAGAFSAARRKRDRRDLESAHQSQPVERLLKLRAAYCDGTVPQPILFDQLWEELRSLGVAGHATPTPAQAVRAAGDVVPEESWALLRSLVLACDAVRYGKDTLDRDQVVAALDDAVALVTGYTGRSL